MSIYSKIKKEVKKEVQELVTLIRMAEKYEVLISNGFMPLDNQSFFFNDQRLSRIERLLRKHDADPQA